MPREQWEAMRPALTPDNQTVMRVWDFCGGWQPQVLPIALAFYSVADADHLIDRLLALRALLAARVKS